MKDFPLKDNERLDDLQRDNLFVIQNSHHYCFSIDSVLLSDFVKLRPSDNALELCSGSGVVSILVNSKCHPRSILGIERDADLYDMSTRSLKYNEINNISFVHSDLKDTAKYVETDSLDAVFTNPPYLKMLDDMSRISPRFVSTKYETTTNIDEILSVTFDVLKSSGRLYIIFSTPRLQELLMKANMHNLFLKTIQFVYFKKDAPSALVMCEFVKNIDGPCTTISPIYVCE